MDPQVPQGAPAPLVYPTFDEIMAAPDITVLDVPVPEWGAVKVQVTTLSAAAMLRYIADSKVGDGAGGEKLDNTLAMQNLIVAGVALPALTFAQVQAMWQKSWPAIQRIQQAILKLNKMTAEDKEEVAAAFPDESSPGTGV